MPEQLPTIHRLLALGPDRIAFHFAEDDSNVYVDPDDLRKALREIAELVPRGEPNGKPTNGAVQKLTALESRIVACVVEHGLTAEEIADALSEEPSPSFKVACTNLFKRDILRKSNAGYVAAPVYASRA